MIIVKADIENQKDYKITPVGNHLACCYRIVDLGTQKSTWNGVAKMQRKIMFNWEIHSEDAEGNVTCTENGEPLSISKRYTMTLLEQASLRKDLESWRGQPFSEQELKGFNVENVLGKFCMINVVHNKADNGKTYANVSGISSVPSLIKKTGLPEQHNKNVIFSLDNFNQEVFNGLAEWIQEIIKSSPEYLLINGESNAYKNVNDVLKEMESSIPF